MNAHEFVNSVNQSIAPDSGLRPITVTDLRRWAELGFLKHAPKFHQFDKITAVALLEYESEVTRRRASPQQERQALPGRTLQLTIQKGIFQVITCIASNPNEEQRIIQGLKEANLIGSAGMVVVNPSHFLGKFIDISSNGPEAKQGAQRLGLLIQLRLSGY